MNYLLEFYKSEINKLLEICRNLSDQYNRAGVANSGDYKNKISGHENDIKEYESKIRAIEEEEEKAIQGKKILIDNTTITIYVITGTNTKIKNALTEEELRQLYFTIDPLNHDDDDRSMWIPFPEDKISIKNLLDKLQRDGYRFNVYYMDGYRFDDYFDDGYEFATDKANLESMIYEHIENNINNTIAIVDLLAIDEENEKIIRRFNRQGNLVVITPICRFLPDKLIAFMVSKRKQLFNYLEYLTQSNKYSGFNDASESMFLKRTLTQKLNSQPHKKQISNINTEEGQKIRDLKLLS